MLLLLLTANYKFLAHWQGHYTIMERMCLVNYCLQLYHVNLLKHWIESLPSLSGFTSVPAGSPGHTLIQQGEDLTPAQCQDLNKLVEQFQNVFSAEPGRTNLIRQEVKPPPIPRLSIRQCSYCISEAHQKAVEEEVTCILEDGIIEESTSPWCSPMEAVPKPDGSVRICNDFCHLNQIRVQQLPLA